MKTRGTAKTITGSNARLVRVNLFDPVKAPIYGTATARDILEVFLVALLFCAFVGLVVLGLVHLLLTWRD